MRSGRPGAGYGAARLPYAALAFLLLFSPLAFGAVETWSLALMELTALGAGCLWALRGRGDALMKVPGALPFLLLLAFALFQALPLPPFFLKALSPTAHALYRETLGPQGDAGWASIALDRKAAVSEFLRLASYGVVYALAVLSLRGGRRPHRIAGFAAAVAAGLAFMAIMQYFTSPRSALFIRPVPEGAKPFGPYVNRNHFAGLMAMALPLALAVFTAAIGGRSGRGRDHRWWRSEETRHAFAIMSGFWAVLILSAAALSASRGGILAVAVGAAVFLWLRGRGERGGWIVLGIGAVLAVFFIFSVLWLRWDLVAERFAAMIGQAGGIASLRPTIWGDTLRIVADYPLVGVGMGGYEGAYPMYRSLIGSKTAQHAENDYLETLAEGGVIGAALAVWFLAAVFRAANRGRGEGRDVLRHAAIAGVAAFMVHGLWDFNLRIGANGLYLFFLLGLMAASSAKAAKANDAEDADMPNGGRRWIGNSVGLVLGCLFLIAALINAGFIMGERAHKRALAADYPSAPGEALAAARAAVRFDPLEAGHRFILARAVGRAEGERAALVHYRAAVRLKPASSLYVQRLGFAYNSLGEAETAGRLIGAGAALDRNNPLRREVHASWLLSRGMRSLGRAEVREAVRLDPENTRRYIAFMVLHGLKDREIEDSLPEIIGVRWMFARYLEDMGRLEDAGEAYVRALRYVGQEEGRRGGWFLYVGRFFLKRGRADTARDVLQRGIFHDPLDADLRREAGDAYARLGLARAARLEFERALELRPGDASIKLRLSALASGPAQGR